MLCALTRPVPDAKTDLGVMLPLIVAITFIFVGCEYGVAVSVARLGVEAIARVAMAIMAMSLGFMAQS
jgi:hypothetical protein